jgi:cellulose biosynthesis protein BcsQ
MKRKIVMRRKEIFDSLEEFERRNRKIFLKIARNLEKMKKKNPKQYRELMREVREYKCGLFRK